MTAKSAALLNEALALTNDERAAIAAELLASLDEAAASDADELDAVWAAEMSARSKQLASGEAATETWDDILRRVAEDRRTR